MQQIHVYGVAPATATDIVDPAALWPVALGIPFAVVEGWAVGRGSAHRSIAVFAAIAAVVLQGGCAAFYVLIRFSGDVEPVARSALETAWIVYLGSATIHAVAIGATVGVRHVTAARR